MCVLMIEVGGRKVWFGLLADVVECSLEQFQRDQQERVGGRRVDLTSGIGCPTVVS